MTICMTKSATIISRPTSALHAAVHSQKLLPQPRSHNAILPPAPIRPLVVKPGQYLPKRVSDRHPTDGSLSQSLHLGLENGAGWLRPWRLKVAGIRAIVH